MRIARSRKNLAIVLLSAIFGFLLAKLTDRIHTNPLVLQEIGIQAKQLCTCQCNGNNNNNDNNENNNDNIRHEPLHATQSIRGEQEQLRDGIVKKEDKHNVDKPRKFFIDCGGNVASSVVLFRETYPDAAEYYIHSFELDDRLCPYFAPYENHTIHCPVAVSNVTGKVTAYAEASWYPGKAVGGEDKQWGGGSLFVSKNESVRQDGGERMLSYRKTVPSIDLSLWLRENVRKEDYVILKLDVEGAEYGILRKMLNEGTIYLVDKLYGEYHNDQPTGAEDKEKVQIKADLKVKKYSMLRWVGERKTYHDFEFLHPTKVWEQRYSPNAASNVIRKCGLTGTDRRQVAIAIEVGMGRKTAVRLIETIRAYKKTVPCTLFVYGDFVEQFPGLVKNWSVDFDIGVRGSGPQPGDVWENLNAYYTRMSVTSGIMRLEEIGIEPVFVLPQTLSNYTIQVVQKRGLWSVDPNAPFPPKSASTLTESNYFKYRDVERAPKALRYISDNLIRDEGGIISLDTDMFDSYMISVFLLDYLFENSGFQLVDLKQCYD